MKILVNGKEQEHAAPLTVANLVESLQLQPAQVAVEVNLNILDRTDFPNWTLQDGDKVEILSFVGGGSFCGE